MRIIVAQITRELYSVEADNEQSAIECRRNGVGDLLPNRQVRYEIRPPVASHHIPVAQKWPILLLPLKAMAQEGDRGAGDIIERTVGPLGGDAFQKWYKLIFGKDCGCNVRKEYWNIRYPLPK